MTDLARHIHNTSLMDTHEHLEKEDAFQNRNPDVLQDLFRNYVEADLVVAGATPEQLKDFFNTSNGDIASRFNLMRDIWHAVQYTGYGEAVRIVARQAYGLDEITGEGLMAAQKTAGEQYRPGMRYKILKERGNLDHVQVDDFLWECEPDAGDPNFFLYDINVAEFVQGKPRLKNIHETLNIQVRNLASLDEAMHTIFARWGKQAVAVKSQHAYDRTLRWEPRSDEQAQQALEKYVAGKTLSVEEHLCLGDWCWGRIADLSQKHNLPFKIHTGYYAGHSRMPVDFIKAGNLCALLKHYPATRFVLMHIAYPYNDELLAIAKHYPNVWIDMCWAWSIDPFSACQFVRQFIHTVPSNKLFIFGGDTFFPNSAVAYATQCRHWLTRALQNEVNEQLITERQAIDLASRFMRGNQLAVFDLQSIRAAIGDKLRHNVAGN